MKNYLLLCVVAGLLSATPLHAGKFVSACKDENGRAYFSDVGCPDGTDRQGTFYAPNAQSSGVGLTSGEAALAQEYEARARSSASEAASRGSYGNSSSSAPTLTYKEAQQKALRESGYKNYDRLTRHQRARVDSETRKYMHLPPASKEGTSKAVVTKDKKGGHTRKTARQGDAKYKNSGTSGSRAVRHGSSKGGRGKRAGSD